MLSEILGYYGNIPMEHSSLDKLSSFDVFPILNKFQQEWKERFNMFSD